MTCALVVGIPSPKLTKLHLIISKVFPAPTVLIASLKRNGQDRRPGSDSLGKEVSRIMRALLLNDNMKALSRASA